MRTDSLAAHVSLALALLWVACSGERSPTTRVASAEPTSAEAAPSEPHVEPGSPPSSSAAWRRVFRNEASGDPDMLEELAFVSDVALNPRGEAMVVGSFSGILRLGDEHVGDAHRWMDQTPFALVLDPAGQRTFAWHGERGSDPRVIAVGDDFVLALALRGDLAIGGREVPGSSSVGGVFVRLAADGTARWAAPLNASGSSQIASLAAAGESVWAGGAIRGTSALHPMLAAEAEGSRTFLVRLDAATGAPGAVAILTSPSQVGVHTLAPQADGGVIVLGDFHVSMSIGDQELQGERLKRGFLARFDSDAALVWLRRLGETAPFAPGGMSAHPGGAVSVFGVTNAALRVGDAPVPIEEGPLGIGVSPDGELRWSLALPQLRGSLLRDVEAFAGGSLLLVGAPNAPTQLLEVSERGELGEPRRRPSAPGMIPAAFALGAGSLTIVSNTEQVGVAGDIVRAPYSPGAAR